MDNLKIQNLKAGEDIIGAHKRMGISTIDFKYTPKSSNDVLVLENTFRQKGGPPRHLHNDQDEWFYAVAGDFIIEIGEQRFNLKPGDSILAPRKISHVWAFLGEQKTGKMLITFLPAGKMEAFFNLVSQSNAMPPQDPDLLKEFGMELLGPPLTV